jgi:hypothetical protein
LVFHLAHILCLDLLTIIKYIRYEITSNH